MNSPSLYLSASDHRRLRDLLAALSHDPKAVRFTARLRDEVARAQIVSTRPIDNVGLDCRVEVLDLDTNETDAYTLVLPERADVDRGRLSVLTPLGTALLGYAVGNEFSWEMPGGVRRLRIARVSPETSATAALSVSS